MNLKVVSFNIHKGFNTLFSRYNIKELKSHLQSLDADLIFIQEVTSYHPKSFNDSHIETQFEYLADQIWTHYAYGKNAVYKKGHHGNAILSRYPIAKFTNIDLSVHRFERRGLLHAEIIIPERNQSIQALCAHLDMLELTRQHQVRHIIRHFQNHIAPDSAVVLAGDFNDWRERVTPQFNQRLELQEAFLQSQGGHALSFPNFYPKLALDRVYFKNLNVRSAAILRDEYWGQLSDHLPLVVNFELPA